MLVSLGIPEEASYPLPHREFPESEKFFLQLFAESSIRLIDGVWNLCVPVPKTKDPMASFMATQQMLVEAVSYAYDV